MGWRSAAAAVIIVLLSFAALALYTRVEALFVLILVDAVLRLGCEEKESGWPRR